MMESKDGTQQVVGFAVEEMVKDFEVDGRNITVKMDDEEVSACIDGACHTIGVGKGLFDSVLSLLNLLFSSNTQEQESIPDEAPEDAEL